MIFPTPHSDDNSFRRDNKPANCGSGKAFAPVRKGGWRIVVRLQEDPVYSGSYGGAGQRLDEFGWPPLAWALATG